MRHIEGQRAGLVATRHGIVFRDRELGRVDAHDLAAVFDVDVDISLAIGHAGLRLAAEWNRAHNFPGGGIDHRAVLGFGVEGVHALGRRVVQDGVGTLAHFHLVEHLQRLEVEDGEHVVAAAGDESAAQFRSERHAMNSGEVGDVAGGFQRLGVDHHDVSAAGDEQTIGIAVVGEVVPTAFAAEFDAVGQLVGLLSGCRNRNERSGRED